MGRRVSFTVPVPASPDLFRVDAMTILNRNSDSLLIEFAEALEGDGWAAKFPDEWTPAQEKTALAALKPAGIAGVRQYLGSLPAELGEGASPHGTLGAT
jgi:hypothetical protein